MPSTNRSELTQQPSRDQDDPVPGESPKDTARRRAAREAAMTGAGSAATMCQAFQATAARYPQQVALRTPGGALTITWRQYAERVRQLAAGLAALDVGRGEPMALMMTNRPEFHLADTAAFDLGAVPFSVCNTLAAGQIARCWPTPATGWRRPGRRGRRDGEIRRPAFSTGPRGRLPVQPHRHCAPYLKSSQKEGTTMARTGIIRPFVKGATVTFSLGRRIGATMATTGVVVLSALASLAPPASASTSPPGATPEAQAEAVVQPSLVFIQATGVVQVPMSDGSTQNYNVTAPWCSGAVVDSSGIILTAGHCADPQVLSIFLIDTLYQQLASQGQTGTLTQSDAEQNWSTDNSQTAFQVYSLATVSRIADIANPMTASVVPGSDRPLGQGDVALLKVNPANQLPALQVASASPTDGTNLVAAGFPVDVTGNVDIGSLTPTLTPGQVTSTQAVNGNPFTGVSATESPGMSGGPVVSIPDGAIYGTVSWGPGDPNAQQLNFATGTTTVQAELRQFNVSPTLDPADLAYRAALADYFSGKYREAVPLFNAALAAMPNDVWAQHYLGLAKQYEPLESTGGSNLLPFIAGGASMLVLAGGITFFLLLRRRHRTTAEPALAAPASLTPAAQSMNGASCPACGAARTPGRACSSCGEPYPEPATT